ncbi:MAG: asparagine synthase (glutamine-hydrolyzing) [Ferruginibacter sp.]
MCRIAGIISAQLSSEERQLRVKDMCNIQAKGGPDDEGFYTAPEFNLNFGHRRLSLIDLSVTGHQPMLYEVERYVITFNGEIYNYLEIKEELVALGFSFQSTSDTEVILAAFAHWGTAAFPKLNGMFAFALLDKLKGFVYLVRDAAGMKPLYYSTFNDSFAFSSEVRALATIPFLNVPDPHWQVYFLAYGHLPEPVTTLKHVQPLEKGHYLEYNLRTQQTKLFQFSKYSFVSTIHNRANAKVAIKQTLTDAVKRHLISDAPIGVFLSGGIDSSILALLAAKSKQVLKTSSIFFNQELFSEKKYQDIIREKIDCAHYQHLITEAEFDANLSTAIGDMDLPTCDGINTWFISKYAHESGLKAVLSGIGGDELFGGYPSFSRMKYAKIIAAFPNEVLRFGRNSNYKVFKRLPYLTIPGIKGKYLFLRGIMMPAVIARNLNIEEAEVWNILSNGEIDVIENHFQPFNIAANMEFNWYMQNQLLRDADVMSMAHGLEIRLPFLDDEMIKLSCNIDQSLKSSGSYTKQLLIDSFADILPEPIWKRKKMGFAFPFAHWFKQEKYAHSFSGKDLTEKHQKFLKGEIPWSHFFSLLLLDDYQQMH